MRLCIVFLSLAVTARRCFAADPKPMLWKEALQRHLPLYAIRPEYSDEVLQRYALTPDLRRYYERTLTGKGIFELRFDYETGDLREIHVVKSTGSPTLDRYPIDSLKHWKAKPRALNAVLYPVEFMGIRAR